MMDKQFRRKRKSYFDVRSAFEPAASLLDQGFFGDMTMSGLGARPSIDLPPKTHVGIKQLGRLQLNLLGHFEGIIDFNAEVPDSALQLGMPKKQLYRP